MGLSREQLEGRKEYLGGSDIATILGLSQHKKAEEIRLEKLGRLTPTTNTTEAANLGNLLEHVLVQAEAEDVNAYTVMEQVHAVGPVPFLRANLDAVFFFEGEKATPVEIKTSGLTGPVWGEWGESGIGPVPQNYLIQSLWNAGMLRFDPAMKQAAIGGFNDGILSALLGGRGRVSYNIHYDNATVEKLINFAMEWWKQHVEKDQPCKDAGSVPVDVLKRLIREPKKQVPVADEIIAAWGEAKDMEKAATKTRAEKEGALLAALGDAEAGTFSGGMVTYFEQSRKEYVSKASTYRVLRIKKEGK